ncbi:MAG: hypothetical protein GY854_25605 [Deltaproteobacteria bacterium]|nr:hypothetical protein [Deltaproteobacteria bacterium]
MNWITGRVSDVLNPFMPYIVSNYTAWPDDAKSMLFRALFDFESGDAPDTPRPPEHPAMCAAEHHAVHMGVFQETAFRYYIARVARTFYVDRNELIPWSILSPSYRLPLEEHWTELLSVNRALTTDCRLRTDGMIPVPQFGTSTTLPLSIINFLPPTVSVSLRATECREQCVVLLPCADCDT